MTDRLSVLIEQRRKIDIEITTVLLENVTSTAAATTIAGYETLKRQLERFMDAGGLGIESLQTLYVAQQTHLTTLQAELRALAAERRAAGAELRREIAELRAIVVARQPLHLPPADA